MKIAFYTSIVGMIASILMKFIQAGIKQYQDKKDFIDYEDGTEVAKNMIDELKSLNSLLNNNQEKMIEQFKVIDEKSNKRDEIFIKEIQEMNIENKNLNSLLLSNQENIVEQFKLMKENMNNNQENIIKEIKLLGTDMNRKQDELISEFRSFTQTMAEQNSKSLIEALKEVIRDFNDKITEQFGENFKQLNEAVGALLIWQDNYKEHVEITVKQLETTIKAVDGINESMNEIANKSEVLINVGEKLEPVLIRVDENQRQIQNNMEVLSEVSDNAQKFIPSINTYFEQTNKAINSLLDNTMNIMENNMSTIEGYINKLTTSTTSALDITFNAVENKFENSTSIIENYVNDYLYNFNPIINQLKEAIPEINRHILETTGKFNETLTTFKNQIHKSLQFNLESIQIQVKTIEETTNKVGGNLETSSSNLRRNIENINQDMSEQIKNMVENTEEVFKTKVDQLHKTLEIELNNSLKTLGTQLVQISNRFAQDYTPLADRLRDVLNIAKGVK